MSSSRGHVGAAAVRLGVVLALGAVLAAAQDVRTRELEPDTDAPLQPPARTQLALVPVPVPAPEPVPQVVETAVAEPQRRSAPSRARRLASGLLLVVLVAAWAWFLLPQSLGGRASWVLVSGKSMLPRYHTGDLVLVRKQSTYHVGEVIAYRVPKGDPMAGLQVIHRIVGGDAVHGFVVEGDNRTAPDSWRPTPEDIVGAKLLRIPYGSIVIESLRSPLMLGMLAASFAFVYVLASLGGGAGPENETEGETVAEAEEPQAA
jgi:signal peptidase I